MFEFEFKEFEKNKIGKSRQGKAKMFEFEFKGFEMNKIGKSRCGGDITDFKWYSKLN